MASTPSDANSPESLTESAAAVSGSLDAIEAELTRDVPALLETMNKSSDEVNRLETEAGAAERQYQQSLADWTSLLEGMRTSHGHTFDAVRPYFDAVHRARSASQRAQTIVKAFASATSQCKQANAELRKIEECLAYGAHSVSLDWEQQEGLSRATVHALKSQQDRDKCEHEYTSTLKEYEEAKKAAEICRSKVGKSQIQRMVPCFRQLQQSQLHLDERRKHLAVMQERIRIAKYTYNQSMRGLERISTAVHNARKEHAAKEKTKQELGESVVECCPEQDHPVAENAETVFGDDCLKTADNALLAASSKTGQEATCRKLQVDDSPFA